MIAHKIIEEINRLTDSKNGASTLYQSFTEEFGVGFLNGVRGSLNNSMKFEFDISSLDGASYDDGCFNLPFDLCYYEVNSRYRHDMSMILKSHNDSSLSVIVIEPALDSPYRFLRMDVSLVDGKIKTTMLDDYANTECDPLFIADINDNTKEMTEYAVMVFNGILSCSNITYVNHIAPKGINRKRTKKNKLPLFSYKTLELIQSPKEVNVNNQGGSHASPRIHLRRGHIRTLASGEKIWVNNCVVGDKTKGMIHKDYKVTT